METCKSSEPMQSLPFELTYHLFPTLCNKMAMMLKGYGKRCIGILEEIKSVFTAMKPTKQYPSEIELAADKLQIDILVRLRRNWF